MSDKSSETDCHATLCKPSASSKRRISKISLVLTNWTTSPSMKQALTASQHQQKASACLFKKIPRSNNSDVKVMWRYLINLKIDIISQLMMISIHPTSPNQPYQFHQCLVRTDFRKTPGVWENHQAPVVPLAAVASWTFSRTGPGNALGPGNRSLRQGFFWAKGKAGQTEDTWPVPENGVDECWFHD